MHTLGPVGVARLAGASRSAPNALVRWPHCEREQLPDGGEQAPGPVAEQRRAEQPCTPCREFDRGETLQN